MCTDCGGEIDRERERRERGEGGLENGRKGEREGMKERGEGVLENGRKRERAERER